MLSASGGGKAIVDTYFQSVSLSITSEELIPKYLSPLYQAIERYFKAVLQSDRGAIGIEGGSGGC
jgi:hypothetical protein